MQTDIYVEGVIGDDWFSENPVTLKNVRSQIQDDTDEIILHINSPGGYVTEAWAIHDYLRMLGMKSTAIINGICASATTIITAACDQVHMSQNSEFMIHLPWTIAMGNSEEMEEIVELLKTEEYKIARLYADYTGKNIRTMRNLMAEEKFWDADRAKAEGFIDKIIPTNKKKSKQTSNLKAIATLPQMSKEMKIAACINRNQININMSEKKSRWAKLKAFIAAEENTAVIDLHLSLADGSEMEVVTDATEPAIGDEVRMGNKPAEDDSYTTVLGDVITVKGGKITAIDKREVQNAKDSEKIAALESKLTAIQTELTQAKEANAQVIAEYESNVKEVKTLKESITQANAKYDKVFDLLKNLSSEGNEVIPTGTPAFNSGDGKGLEESSILAAVNEIKADRAKSKASV